MAITNQERIGKAMDLLRVGLAPFVEREVRRVVLHLPQRAPWGSAWCQIARRLGATSG